MKRSFLLSTLLFSLALAATAWLVAHDRATQLPERPDRPSIDDAPIGWIECERLPLHKPEGQERDEDHQSRPYTAVVDVLDWPEMTPRPIEASQIEVPSAGSVQWIAPGRVLVSGIELGMSMVSVLATAKDLPDELVYLATGRRGLLAQRNPVAFARHGITHCQVVVFEADDLQATAAFRGRVLDRETGSPLEGAAIVTGLGNVTRTDAEGRFEFPEPMKLQEAFSSGVEMPGYVPFTLTLRSLTIPWIEHWRSTGEMVVTLGRAAGSREPFRPFPKSSNESADR